MYCPKCKKDIKPGSEIKSMSQGGKIMMGIGFVGSIVNLWAGLHPLGGVFLVVVFVGGGFLLGQRNPQTVCPACGEVLIPENPFSEL